MIRLCAFSDEAGGSLQAQIDAAKQKVADLQYEVDAPIDESYVEDWGKDNGFEYPDATVYIPNS